MQPRPYNHARITTGRLNTVDDLLPGTIVQNNTGVAQYQGQVGQKFTFTHAQLLKRWDTTVGSVPAGDLDVQYVKIVKKNSAGIDAARGLLVYWADKANGIVTTDDTGGFRFAGVLISNPATTNTLANKATASYCFIAKVGELQMKFKSSTTKTTPAIGDTAVGVSGNSSLADVLADATGQTYGTDETNLKVGTLTSAVTTQLATVAVAVDD